MVNLFVEQIPPLYLCCDTLITAQDVASASRFQNERRRMEHLAWRRIVRRELGKQVTIEYNEVGAPQVDSEGRQISVAHCDERVAVAIADERVGVDIERIDRDFSRVAERIMSQQERSLTTEDCWAGMVWCAKEAMYKYYGNKGVDLLHDLQILEFDAATKRMGGQLPNRELVTIDISIYEERYIVATATSKR